MSRCTWRRRRFDDNGNVGGRADVWCLARFCLSSLGVDFQKHNSTEIVSGAAAATTKIDDDNQRLDPDYV